MEPFLGQIQIFGFIFAPRGWAFCNGQLLPIAQNTALFSLLGTTYGGDGRTTFALPNLQGRVPLHFGTGPGLTERRIGSSGGSETETLIQAQLPAHNHTATSVANAVGPSGNSNDALNNFWADDAATASGTYHTGPATGTMNAAAITTTVENAGGGQSHPNMQPFLTLNFCIALQGIFPSRS